MKIRRLFQDLPLSLVSLGSLGLLAAPILQAAPAAQEHPTSALSDAIWQPGIALDSQDNALAGRTITATGAAWPNGSTTYQTQTAADGSFRVAFAPGTARGLVQLEGAPEFLGAPVWRPWYQHEIVLRGSKPRQVRVPVVDYGTEPRQSPRVWVRQFSWDGISEQTSLPSPVAPTMKFSFAYRESLPVMKSGVDWQQRKNWRSDWSI